MNEDALQTLDNFLLSEACDEDTLSVDEAHGYLTAVQLLPEECDDVDWSAAVWGQPAFRDEQQRSELSGLLQGMFDEIGRVLRQREPFEPLVIETEEEGELIESHEGWCFGFMLAVEQNAREWEALPKSAQGLLAPMAQLALLAADEEAEMSEEEYEQWVELLPGAVSGLYDFWHSQ